MGGQQLTCRTEVYLEEPKATKLHTVDVWTCHSAPVSREDKRIWLIYIHGGAWRDPEVDSKSFEPAVNAIWKSALRDSIAGFASINYRLSSYPSHSKFPSLPDDPSRNVHYPAHIEDVAQALLYLDENYQIGNRYFLVGHSAGATMAFELHNSYLQSGSLPQPVCVLGISGIFDFEAFVENHSEIPVYKKIMDNSFPDKSLWEEASPYINRSLGHIWEQAKVVVISHSKQDGLVEYSQATSMLERVRAIAHCSERVHFLEASGAHDEIWENGNILAGLIMECLKMLQSYRRDWLLSEY